MKKKKDTKPYVFQVSTKPDSSSYRWIGQEVSILSTILLWAMWACRMLSLYQHLKAIRRILKKHRAEKRGKKGHRVTNESGRPDIPPMFGEVYFILWTVFFVLMHIFDWSGGIVRGAAIYYLFETTVWIFYYTVFRRFFELGYSIYHKLEYLTQIVLILPTQALCYAHLYDRTFREMIAGLLGAATDNTPLGVTVLGCLFSAIVISMIISAFPMEEIKKADTRPKMFVVGCGDVVQKRLYPALRSILPAEKVKVFDLNSSKNRLGYCTYLENQEEICQLIDKEATERDVVWIETPSYAHIPYLKALLDTDVGLIVLEKPISVYPSDLQYVEKEVLRVPAVRKRVFFLSYYVLEKALPLHYLVHLNEKYKDYLDLDDESLLKNWRVLLGALKSAKVHICEGEDSREWVQEKKYSGQLLETFLHNVLIASLFAGRPQDWTDVFFNETYTADGEHEITLTAKHHCADIDLYLKKNAKDESLHRYAEFCFANGKIYADLDRKHTDIFFADLDEHTTLSVRETFDRRYSVMTDMVYRVAARDRIASETDGIIHQLDVIRWLLELRDFSQ